MPCIPCLYPALPPPPTISQARRPSNSRIPVFESSKDPASPCKFLRVPVFPASSCEFLRVPAIPCEFLRVPASSSVPIRGEESRRDSDHQSSSISTPVIRPFVLFVLEVQASSDPSDHLLILFSLLIFVVCYMDAFVVHRFTVHNVHSAYSFSSHSFGFY